jgi:thioredoxin 1
MLGVMKELEQRYPGAMEVEFVNVAKQPAEAERVGVEIIPTQIFYAPDGRELYRHVGVLRTEQVVAKWAELGFPITAARQP